MTVNMDKTFSQHVHRCAEVEVTAKQVKTVEEKYKYKSDFYPRKFKTE